jgi:hypothetical protein
MGGPRSDDKDDRLNRTGEEPAVESGAGYGSHAPEPSAEPDEAKDRAESRE